MLDSLAYLGVTFMGFLAIMNPLSGMSVFLTLTHDEDDDESKIIAKQGLITAFAIVFTFSFFGNFLLHLFHVTFTALRLTGGILVAIIGYEMLHGKQSNVIKPSKETIEKSIREEGSVAVTPLGIPLLAGPGVIITAMNFSAGGMKNLFVTLLGFGVLCIMTYFVFISAKKIKKFCGASALKVLTRMMGLILAVIGVQMLIEGFYSAVTEYNAANFLY